MERFIHSFEKRDKHDQDKVRVMKALKEEPLKFINQLGDGSHPKDGIYTMLKQFMEFVHFLKDFPTEMEITLANNLIMIKCSQNYPQLPKGVICKTMVKELIYIFSRPMYIGFGNEPYEITKDHSYITPEFVHSVYCENLMIYRKFDGYQEKLEFARGELILVDYIPGHEKMFLVPIDIPNGYYLQFQPDHLIFGDYAFEEDHIRSVIEQYIEENKNLKITFQEQIFKSASSEHYTHKGFYDNIFPKKLPTQIHYLKPPTDINLN